jgi:hypothetical protein
MAQTSREIKRRIASITNTQQITRAMEMVAACQAEKGAGPSSQHPPLFPASDKFPVYRLRGGGAGRRRTA